MIQTYSLLGLFSNMDLSEFWASILSVYQNIAKKALRMTLPFVTTYRCEASFPTLTTMETKNRIHLDAGHDMRLALSETEPRIERLVERNNV